MGSTFITKIKNIIVPPGSIAIFWIGQSGFVFKTSNHKVVYIDPYLSNCVERIEGLVRLVPAPLLPGEVEADIILLTHDHIDHVDPDCILEICQASKASIIGPTSCINHLLKIGVDSSQVSELNRGNIIELDGIRIGAVYSKDFSEDGVGYILKSDGITTYITGDTSYVPELDLVKIALIDILITSINGGGKYGNLTPQEATQLTLKLQPRYVIPAHYGMFKENTGDPGKFLEALSNAKSTAEPILIKHGDGQVIDCEPIAK
jgi:L-ascorbate 6-phosphate lactonase